MFDRRNGRIDTESVFCFYPEDEIAKFQNSGRIKDSITLIPCCICNRYSQYCIDPYIALAWGVLFLSYSFSLGVWRYLSSMNSRTNPTPSLCLIFNAEFDGFIRIIKNIMKFATICNLSFLGVLLITSCKSSKEVQSSMNSYPQYQQQYQSRNEPDSDGFVEIKKSPMEELALAIGTNEIRAYGSAESGNAQMAYNAARAQATAALKEKIEVYVRAGLDQYSQEVGVNNEYTLDESTRNQIITAVKGIINGASVLDSRKMYNPNSKRYKYEVCMKYDRAGILSVMQQQSARIRNNEKQFEADMKEAWDALDAENNRETLGEQQKQRNNEMEQNNLDRENNRQIERMKQQQNPVQNQN